MYFSTRSSVRSRRELAVQVNVAPWCSFGQSQTFWQWSEEPVSILLCPCPRLGLGCWGDGLGWWGAASRSGCWGGRSIALQQLGGANGLSRCCWENAFASDAFLHGAGAAARRGDTPASQEPLRSLPVGFAVP